MACAMRTKVGKGDCDEAGDVTLDEKDDVVDGA